MWRLARSRWQRMSTHVAQQDIVPDQGGEPADRPDVQPQISFPRSETLERLFCAVPQAAAQKRADEQQDVLTPSFAVFAPVGARRAHFHILLVLLDHVAG